ncbi:AraC family transcriptional regulator [Mycolicibacterium sp. HK-90]|uniref:helix-turn-helix domain-containing protein n=1 Tax=Mycolicibacterium sp. HK-90 TaxID=3056937 RepID=UPI00265B0966|nr:AraC family transcriptional regulator [Mycolicibacterium sp. HK-90]WKG03447.1 AraC family transcriptional regulator [Mycolicibacterium sp. HK-90]
MPDVSRLVRHRDGVPVYRYWTDRDVPPVSVIRGRRADLPEHRPHIHDFPVLWYAPAEAVVYVVAAGEVVDPRPLAAQSDGTGVFFDPAALGHDAGSPWPTWQAHPLLFPFIHGQSGGLLQLHLPDDRQPLWNNTIRSIEMELTGRRDGYRQATLAHLTLLLIDVARLTEDVVGDLRRSGEPLLAEVFAVIDRRLSQPLSLSDVAAEVGMTPGHLTTVVRRRTGRTVGEWINERRMSRARELLGERDLTVAEIANRVGMTDPGYFSRQFRRAHRVSPREWRRTGASGIRTESP